MRITSVVLRSCMAGLGLASTLAIPSSVAAQGVIAPVAAPQVAAPASIATTPSSSLLLVGPRHVQAGVTRLASTAPLTMAPMPASTRRNTAWMVVGGATLVVGSVVGGDAGTIMMVTGGVIGLMGLYRHMQ